MYIFSRLPQIFRKPMVAIPGRNGGCLHGELFAFSSRDKFPLGHSDQVESFPGVISSRARHVNACTHTCTNRVEVSSFSYNIIAF